MKKKKSFVFSLVKRLVLPFGVLCFLLLSASSISAQNYKSLQDASIAVKQAVAQLESQIPANRNLLTPAQRQIVVNRNLFTLFLTRAHDLNSVKKAYIELTGDGAKVNNAPATSGNFSQLVSDNNNDQSISQARIALRNLITI